MGQYTWRTYVEGLAFANVQGLLRDLSWSHGCELEILNTTSTFWKERVEFEFTGTKEKLQALKEDFELAVLKYNLPSEVMSKDYRIESLVGKESNKEVSFELKAPKSSRIRDLSDAIADELGMSCSVEEKSNGFLKGKTVSLSATGSHKQLKAFKALFIECLNEAEYRTKNKPKRM